MLLTQNTSNSSPRQPLGAAPQRVQEGQQEAGVAHGQEQTYAEHLYPVPKVCSVTIVEIFLFRGNKFGTIQQQLRKK